MTEYTPTTEEVRLAHAESVTLHKMDEPHLTEANAEFDRWLDQIETAAKIEGLRVAQQIISGDLPVNETRDRDDMINTSYLIIEIDEEIHHQTQGADDD